MTKSFEQLLDLIIDLKLPDDFLIFGSASLFLKGLRKDIQDIDILAGPKCWDFLFGRYKSEIPKSNSGKIIRLLDGQIEIYNKWWPGEYDIQELIVSIKE